MAVTHSTAALNAATDAVTALLGSGGKLKFRTSGTVSSPGTAAATLSMSSTPFGAASFGTATANAITSDTNAAGNATAVSTATLEDSGGTVVIHCEVGASGSDINLSGGLTIAAGDTVEVTSLTYTPLDPGAGAENITAHRGALTKSGAGSVNTGALLSSPITATSSTYTLTSGTSGHWTLPTDGTFPSPNSTGDTADLNGGPYVFDYEVSDGVTTANGTLTINIRADTYTASLRSELAAIKTAGIDGKTVEFARGATDFASATFASQIDFTQWRSTNGTTIKHEDANNPCQVGNCHVRLPKNLTFEGIIVTPSARTSASAQEYAWYIRTVNPTASTDEETTNIVTFNDCGVTGAADETTTVYGMYVDSRSAPLSLTTQDLTFTWVQYGIFLVHDGDHNITMDNNGQTSVRYFTADAFRFGATDSSNENITFEHFVVMSPIEDLTNAGIHPDACQMNVNSITQTDSVVFDKFTAILADGNATAWQSGPFGVGGVTVKNLLSCARSQHVSSISASSSACVPKIGNVTAVTQWSGVYGSEVAGTMFNRTSDVINPGIYIANVPGSIDVNEITILDAWYQGSESDQLGTFTPDASVYHHGGSGDISAHFPDAGWISSASLRTTALANDTDGYSGLDDARWHGTIAEVIADVEEALTPASGQKGALMSDGSRPLHDFSAAPAAFPVVALSGDDRWQAASSGSLGSDSRYLLMGIKMKTPASNPAANAWLFASVGATGGHANAWARCLFDTSGRFNLTIYNAAGTAISNCQTTASFCDGGVHEFLVSIDMEQATAAAGRQIFIDGSAPSITNFVWSGGSGVTIGYSDATLNKRIGFGASSGLLPSGVELHYAYMNVAENLDISVSGNRDLFAPGSIGSDGSGVTGTAPAVFLVGDAAQWNDAGGINWGTGPNLVGVATVTDVSGSAWS